jgi:hypothetical protein
MPPMITDTALHALSGSAQQVQAALFERMGEVFALPDLMDTLARWLESSIEQLCEDACELVLTGDRTYASFNRNYFEQQLQQVPSFIPGQDLAECQQYLQQASPFDLAA